MSRKRTARSGTTHRLAKNCYEAFGEVLVKTAAAFAIRFLLGASITASAQGGLFSNKDYFDGYLMGFSETVLSLHSRAVSQVPSPKTAADIHRPSASFAMEVIQAHDEAMKCVAMARVLEHNARTDATSVPPAAQNLSRRACESKAEYVTRKRTSEHSLSA